MSIMEIHTTIRKLAAFYGVPSTCVDQPVTLYRDSAGWHVSSPWQDSEWAPVSDSQASEIAAEIGEE